MVVVAVAASTPPCKDGKEEEEEEEEEAASVVSALVVIAVAVAIVVAFDIVLSGSKPKFEAPLRSLHTIFFLKLSHLRPPTQGVNIGVVVIEVEAEAAIGAVLVATGVVVVSSETPGKVRRWSEIPAGTDSGGGGGDGKVGSVAESPDVAVVAAGVVVVVAVVEAEAVVTGMEIRSEYTAAPSSFSLSNRAVCFSFHSFHCFTLLA
jgi:hypothetical protein